MKAAAPFIAAIGGVVIAVLVGVAVFGDKIGLGNVASVLNDRVSDVTSFIVPPKEPVTEVKGQDASASESKTPVTAADPASQKGSADNAPTFDIVRVEPDGNTLVAGRASPGWTVELKNGSAILSKAVADANGEWVMVLNDPLGEGVSDLSLSAQSKDGGDPVVSPSSVSVALSKEGEGELLVVESTPGEASKVLASITPATETPVTDEGQTVATNVGADQASGSADASKPEVMQVAQVEVPKDPIAKPAGNEASAPAANPVVTSPQDTVSSSDQANAAVETPSVPVAKENTVAQTGDPAETKVAIAKASEDPKPVIMVERSVSIEAVEIEGDTLFVAGAAEPAGSLLRLYVDNDQIASSRSGETGRFLFDDTLTLATGDHVARVDLLDPVNGTVLKRAEVSFAKQSTSVQTVDASGTLGDKYQRGVSASATSGPVSTQKVIIRRGDNLWTIARRVYGAGIRFSTIYDNNSDQIRDPHWIYPGQVFELPRGEDGWENNFESIESPSLDAGKQGKTAESVAG
ncbi:LysM peptidoglycan-binding domain-containing protein [uncultured Cohaesibacter sp.]|uniref:LysM peptidoglycan-binding domain-containing protein n=1 Tax=uncultured Cohaesibacter sp. TaxID=1002546 RepID=UPI0029310437|nr:LysM peptidoglycan-binding domain-containing protein [uncultured Cohaesibacter sp.]